MVVVPSEAVRLAMKGVGPPPTSKTFLPSKSLSGLLIRPRKPFRRTSVRSFQIFTSSISFLCVFCQYFRSLAWAVCHFSSDARGISLDQSFEILAIFIPVHITQSYCRERTHPCHRSMQPARIARARSQEALPRLPRT